VTCAGFDRWLDEGRPRAGLEVMSAHAEGCARCMRALAASLELDALLASPVRTAHPSPASFTERVMRRVSATPQVAPVAPPAWLGAKARSAPIWLRVLSDPAAALALIVAALFAWRGPELLSAVPVVGLAISGAVASLLSALRLPSLAPMPEAFPLALMFASLPAMLWLGWRLLRATEALTARVARRG